MPNVLDSSHGIWERVDDRLSFCFAAFPYVFCLRKASNLYGIADYIDKRKKIIS